MPSLCRAHKQPTSRQANQQSVQTASSGKLFGSHGKPRCTPALTRPGSLSPREACTVHKVGSLFRRCRMRSSFSVALIAPQLFCRRGSWDNGGNYQPSSGPSTHPCKYWGLAGAFSTRLSPTMALYRAKCTSSLVLPAARTTAHPHTHSRPPPFVFPVRFTISDFLALQMVYHGTTQPYVITSVQFFRG